MIQFLTTGLWDAIASEARKAQTKRAAIAYVTRDLPLRLRSGDTLIVDASEKAIRSGQTSAAVLRRLHSRGVRLFSHPGLHAKAIVLDRTAFVSSGNLSGSSIDQLLEAGIRTDNPNVVSKAIGFIDDLADLTTPIQKRFLDRIAMIPVERSSFVRRSSVRKKLSKEKIDPKTWLIGVRSLRDTKDPAELKRIEKGERRATDLLVKPGSSIGWIRYTRNRRFSKEARRRDNIVLIWREHDKDLPQIVYRHAPILLNQAEPNCNRIFYELFRDAEKTALSWPTFKRLSKRVGLPFELTRNMGRLLERHMSDALHDLWNTV